MMEQSEGSPTGKHVTLGAMVGARAAVLGDEDAAAWTAYTIWTGIGAVGAFVVGIVVLGEQATALRVASAAMILAGLVGLKVSSPV